MMRLRSRHQCDASFTGVLVLRTESLTATPTQVKRCAPGRTGKSCPAHTEQRHRSGWQLENVPVNDPNCRAHDAPGHVCFDMRGNRTDSDCFFETVSRLADRAHAIDEQVTLFVGQLSEYTPPAEPLR